MKTKLFLAAMAVTFSFAMISCSGNKAANTASDTDSTAVVETVEAAACTPADSCCQAKDSCATSCDKANCDKANCEKKADCAEKKACCDKK